MFIRHCREPKCKENDARQFNYCITHLLILCDEVFQDNNHCQTEKGINKAFDSLLKKILKVLEGRKYELGKEIRKIKKIFKMIESDHKKFQKFLKL